MDREAGAHSACPQCGADMDAGYIGGGRSLMWSTDRPSAGSYVRRESLTGTTWLRPAHVRAWRCRACKVGLVDYGNEDRPYRLGAALEEDEGGDSFALPQMIEKASEDDLEKADCSDRHREEDEDD